MKFETFHNRLQRGKGVTYIYRVEERHGGINIWKYRDEFVLTWEECSNGDEFDEGKYTRDELHHFDTIDAVFAFLNKNSISVEGFTP